MEASVELRVHAHIGGSVPCPEHGEQPLLLIPRGHQATACCLKCWLAFLESTRTRIQRMLAEVPRFEANHRRDCMASCFRIVSPAGEAEPVEAHDPDCVNRKRSWLPWSEAWRRLP